MFCNQRNPLSFNSAIRISDKAMSRQNIRRGWRFWVAIVVALSFLLLVSTASTHHHTKAIEDQSCSVCSSVNVKPHDIEPISLLAKVIIFLGYHFPVSGEIHIAYLAVSLLPPSCGPPSLS
jgi:hypothetical protein